MTIVFKLNETDYSIEVDSTCHTAIRHGVNQDKESKNFGIKTDTQLGYFTNLTNAAMRCVKEELASSPDTVSLKQFADRVADLNEQIRQQFKVLGV